MADTQQSERQGITSSGTSNVPTLLAYPKILDLKDIPEIEGQFVYVLKGYPEDGLSVLIHRNIVEDEVYLQIGDFDGEPIDLTDESHPLQPIAIEFAQYDSSQIIAMMKVAKITKLILYISVEDNECRLVDLRTSLNKFYGPGMIRDLFGKIFPTQEMIKTIALDEQVLEAIKRGEGSYKGNLMLKCSKFKTVVRNNELLPLYARVVR